MSKLKILMGIFSLILVFSQSNYPIIPNPGYDTITIIPVFGTENNVSEIPKTHMENTIKIMTNNSLSVNTSNIDAKCTVECYTGCRILFPEYIEQKFCISNFCRCQIIEKNISESANNNIISNSSSFEIIHSDLNKFGVTQYLDISKKFNVKKEDNSFYLIFYMSIFIFSLGYEFIILKYFEKINEFSFKEWLTGKNNEYKKYRLTKENEFDIINENNNELRRCLI